MSFFLKEYRTILLLVLFVGLTLNGKKAFAYYTANFHVLLFHQVTPIEADGADFIAHVEVRKNLYESIEQLQTDLDDWLEHYNTQRTHQGKMCCGRTPFETMIEGKQI